MRRRNAGLGLALALPLLFSTGLVAPVYAQESPKGGVELPATNPADALSAVQSIDPVSPQEALRRGAKAYYAGDKAAAIDPLNYAAQNGHGIAAWKLGRMYATGDGVPEDDYKAFHYFSQVLRRHGSDNPRGATAPFVANALVEIADYYMTGIAGSPIKADRARAVEVLNYAASYFGDAEAQFQLGLYYLDKDNADFSLRLAARWLKLAATKGHVNAQARFGELLFFSEGYPEVRLKGLKWITLAQMRSAGGDEDRNEHLRELLERANASAEEVDQDTAAQWAQAWMLRRGEMVAAAAVASDNE